MQSVTTQKFDDVLVVIVDNPPVNALSWHVRQGLNDSFEQALSDDNVKAIVLRCAGSTFIAGADITEFGKAPQGPDFNAVLNRIEAAGKPVVAAIHGTALGGGLETALVCHYRIAVPSALPLADAMRPASMAHPRSFARRDDQRCSPLSDGCCSVGPQRPPPLDGHEADAWLRG